MDAHVVDKMLELCYAAVDKMAAEIDGGTGSMAEHGVLTEAQKVEKINKFFHTLGATMGNFLLNFSDTVDQKELVESFKKGLDSFVAYCEADDPHDDGPPLHARPGSLRVFGWLIDNSAYYN